MAISSSSSTFLHEKKYPFIFILSLLFLSFTFLLISNSQSSSFSLPSFNFYRRGTPLQPLTISPQPSAVVATPIDSPESPAKVSVSGEIDSDGDLLNLKWEVCKGGLSAVDYIPCLDNWKAIKALKSRKHMEHRERHCPMPNSRCLVPLPRGYKIPIPWPKSRDMIWYDNVPHPKLVDYKKDQHWVVKSGDHFIFPGGGTQFKEGVANYIQFIEKATPLVKWGQNIRVVLDVGCGVASFGGHLLDKDVLTMSLAPKDEHEAQIQFALERGIPAFLSVIGTQQLTFPDNAYDLIHCARCRVHWDADGGKPLLELNRILRPGGLFIWSATPVYRKDEKDVTVWNSMAALTKSMCWKVVAKTMASTGIGLVVYQKPVSPSCYKEREKNEPPMCEMGRNMSWYSPLQKCLPQLPPEASSWPPLWPKRLTAKPYSLPSAPLVEQAFHNDTRDWHALVTDVYIGGLGINWSSVRNVMDMTAGHGGFAAALIDMPLWVMNVVPVHEPDTLPIIFDRGLIGVYHDWCESFNTYPRTYDLLHSTFLFSNLPNGCDIIDLAAEIDRIVRPGGWVVIQETKEQINSIGAIFRSLQWSVNLYNDRYLVGQKSFWRPHGGRVQR
ncbi:probable methyltransferase PMT23 [Chenopodium quinoa]|uniref:probable methyltransferase PMT23 n=1 Tax=Chenopodium quinoa TaxID=63459 RepID=UPI000B78CB06|nr:probable methyltransferase PMT23 [Chenopodium quinoa]